MEELTNKEEENDEDEMNLEESNETILHDHHRHHGNCCSHDHSDEMQVYQMSTLEKFAACDSFRREGLALFREAQWTRARSKFQKILVYLDYTFPSGPVEEKSASDLKKAALINSTICTLKQHEYRETISLASQVLREWNDQAQAWYCRGKARRKLFEFPEAREDLTACLKLIPKNREVKKELHMVESDERCYQMDSAEFARGMFSSAKANASESSDTRKSAQNNTLSYQ
jgi:tetratricopeptide (TPR) repeat protein